MCSGKIRGPMKRPEQTLSQSSRKSGSVRRLVGCFDQAPHPHSGHTCESLCTDRQVGLLCHYDGQGYQYNPSHHAVVLLVSGTGERKGVEGRRGVSTLKNPPCREGEGGSPRQSRPPESPTQSTCFFLPGQGE